jgi:LysM domain
MQQPVSYSRVHLRLMRSRHSFQARFDVRTLVICAVGMAILVSTACGELEPIVEPEIVDLQLTMDTLKTQVRDAQRNLAEVRTELESRRQELAEAQVARAQLEGRVREAERRVSEARQIIELQREELIAARAERERVFRSSTQLQSQMKQLQRKAPRSVNPATNELGDEIAPAGAVLPSPPKAVVVPPSATPAVNALRAKVSAMTAALRQYTDEFAVEQQEQIPVKHIFVKQGDTLWSLSRKYRIGLNRLRSINHLIDNQIEVGQILFLSEHRTLTTPSAETNR